MVIIAYSLNQICNIAIACKNDASVAKIPNRRLTKIFVAIFALAERLPTSATLTMTMTMTIIMTMTMTSTMTSAFQTSGNTRWPSSAGDLYCFLRIEASAFDI